MAAAKEIGQAEKWLLAELSHGPKPKQLLAEQGLKAGHTLAALMAVAWQRETVYALPGGLWAVRPERGGKRRIRTKY